MFSKVDGGDHDGHNHADHAAECKLAQEAYKEAQSGNE